MIAVFVLPDRQLPISTIVIAELYYLNEKKGRPFDCRAKYACLAGSKQFTLAAILPISHGRLRRM